MPRHRSHSVEFKRQVVEEYLGGDTLHGLAKRHDISRQLIRIWIEKYEAGAFDDDARAADLIQQYETRIAALERLVGKQALELEFLADCGPWRNPLTQPIVQATALIVCADDLDWIRSDGGSFAHLFASSSAPVITVTCPIAPSLNTVQTPSFAPVLSRNRPKFLQDGTHRSDTQRATAKWDNVHAPEPPERARVDVADAIGKESERL